jgi:hypothetical protein
MWVDVDKWMRGEQPLWGVEGARILVRDRDIGWKNKYTVAPGIRHKTLG